MQSTSSTTSEPAPSDSTIIRASSDGRLCLTPAQRQVLVDAFYRSGGRQHSSTSLPACPRPTAVLSDSHAMTATLPWPPDFPSSGAVRRREAGRIRGKAPVRGGSSAGFGSVRRQTHPRSLGSRKLGSTLAYNLIAINCAGAKAMHVACYGYRWYDPLTGRWGRGFFSVNLLE